MTLPYYPVLRLTETEDLQPSMSTQWGLTRGLTGLAVSVVPCKQLGKEMALVNKLSYPIWATQLDLWTLTANNGLLWNYL